MKITIVSIHAMMFSAFSAISLFAASAPLRDLGKPSDTFPLHEAKALAKVSAASPRALPPPGARMRAIAQVGPGFNPADVKPLGWRVVTLGGGFAGLEGDAATLLLLKTVAGLREAQPSRRFRKRMDEARRLARVDAVRSWGPNAAPKGRGYSGKGVLLGNVDSEFDVTHPAFLDSAGRLRFVAVWNQYLQADGTSMFGYGRVKTAAALKNDPSFADDSTTHGTHVISIAGGSNRANAYYGMAPEAALIGVSADVFGETPLGEINDETKLIQSLQWMFHVGDSLRMPCVVNLSLGSVEGPHDGTTLFDRFLDSATGPGHIVVQAAGNDGGGRTHAGFDLKPGDTVGTFGGTSDDAYMDTVTQTDTAQVTLDAWGEPGKSFSFQLLLYDTDAKTYRASRKFVSTQAGSGETVIDTVKWTGSGGAGNRAVLGTLVEKASPGNGRPHVEIWSHIYASTPVRPGLRLAGSGAVHVWNAEDADLFDLGLKGFTVGDDTFSIGEGGSCAKSVIAVGAFTSKVAYKDFQGSAYDGSNIYTLEDRSWFSSKGPTLDGRRKPDLCAPGSLVAAAWSQFTHEGEPAPGSSSGGGGAFDIVLWPKAADRSGRYGVMEGTSMSSPVVAGTVALMLQANPHLDPERARSILVQTAYRDGFTGAAMDNDWGAGKLDAGAAVEAAAGATRIANPQPLRAAKLRVLGDRLAIDGLADAPARAVLHDGRGRDLGALQPAGTATFMLPRTLRSGLYVLTVKQGVYSRAFRFARP